MELQNREEVEIQQQTISQVLKIDDLFLSLKRLVLQEKQEKTQPEKIIYIIVLKYHYHKMMILYQNKAACLAFSTDGTVFSCPLSII